MWHRKAMGVLPSDAQGQPPHSATKGNAHGESTVAAGWLTSGDCHAQNGLESPLATEMHCTMTFIAVPPLP